MHCLKPNLFRIVVEHPSDRERVKKRNKINKKERGKRKKKRDIKLLSFVTIVEFHTDANFLSADAARYNNINIKFLAIQNLSEKFSNLRQPRFSNLQILHKFLCLQPNMQDLKKNKKG